MLAEIKKLSVPERLRLVEEIWDSIAASPEDVPLSDARRHELDRRVRAYRENPQEGVSWEQLKAKVAEP